MPTIAIALLMWLGASAFLIGLIGVLTAIGKARVDRFLGDDHP